MVLRKLQSWIWLVALAPYYIVYSKKAGGFGQILTDLETYSLSKLKTKVGNLVMMGVAVAVLYFAGRAKLPVAAKVIILAVAYFVFGYNLFKTIDDPRYGGAPGAGSYGVPHTTMGYSAYGIQPAFR